MASIEVYTVDDGGGFEVENFDLDTLPALLDEWADSSVPYLEFDLDGESIFVSKRHIVRIDPHN